MELFKVYQVKMEFTDRLYGGVPKHPDVIKDWLEARAPSEAAFAKMVDPKGLPELTEEVTASMTALAIEENKVWSGFQANGNGLFIPGFHIKAHMKDNANICKAILGTLALKSKLADRVFVVEDKLPLGVMEPAGYWEHPVHVMTMLGPRSALKRSDYVVKPVLNCTLKVLNDKLITEEILRAVFTLGSMKGFGAERGLGNGRYSYTLVPVE